MEEVKAVVPDDESCPSPISTLVFMDLEATGLPSLVGKRNVQITEISLIAVDRADFEEDSTLRVLNKLSLCIRPRATISPGAMSITGLYNDVLEKQEKFDDSIPKLLEYFFRRLKRPLCLLAHNGMRYDFPLLQAELQHINYGLDPSILCADTLDAFRCIANPSEISLKPLLATLTENVQTEESKLVKASDEKEISPLDEETEFLLSQDMEIFKDIVEPTNYCTSPQTADVHKSNQIGKVDYRLDEQTPPKTKSTPRAPPAPQKRKLGLISLPKNQPETNLPAAKRQLFQKATKPKFQYTLEKLYLHYFGKDPPQSHYAEADCIALSKVCQRVHKDFLQWIDEHSISFSSVKAMW